MEADDALNPNPFGVPVSDLHEIFSFADVDGDGIVDWGNQPSSNAVTTHWPCRR